jgi:type I restriction enzyme, S subunit
MRSDWTVSPLGELAIVHDDRRRPVKAADRVNGPFPYYGASGIVDYVNGYLFDGEFLLVAEDGENLRTRQTPVAFIARGKFWVNNHAHIITNNEKSDLRFLMYAIRHADIDAYLTGAVMPKLTQGNLNRIQILHPALPAQRAISSVLGSLEDKIDDNRRTAQIIEEFARMLFRAWFVDFEPVKAKVAGTTCFPSVAAEIFEALPASFIDSELGLIPEGWEIGRIDTLANLSKIQIDPQEHPEEIFEHFSIPAFDAGMAPVMELGSAIKSNKFQVTEGCILLSKLNPRIPRLWLPSTSRGRRQIASTEFLVFAPRVGEDRHFIYSQFLQSSFWETLSQNASGTSNSHQRVKPNDLISMPVVVPPLPIRRGFTSLVDQFLALSAANHVESMTLAGLRDYFLPKLLSGEVRIADASLAAEHGA